MSGLYPTPARLRRLAQVERGEVYRDNVGIWHKPTGHRVVAEITALELAGWVERRPHPTLSTWEVYVLAEAGRLALYPPDPDAPEVGAVYADQELRGRRVQVRYVSQISVQVLLTYSTAPNAWELARLVDVIPREEWTARRYVREPEAGAS